VSALVREVFYPHPREQVWSALTDPKALGLWLMPNDFEPRVGHEFTFRTEPGPGWDGVVHCRVLEVDPPVRSEQGSRDAPTWPRKRIISMPSRFASFVTHH
jgi:uncharacterized protein YndB with AHSA1/START domain